MFDTELYKECVRRFSNIGVDFDDVLSDFFRSSLLYGDVPYVDIMKTCVENDLLVPKEDAVVDFSSYPWRKIHPYKRKLINAILKTDIPSAVQQIIVFGSAITPRCRYDSDTDLMIVADTSFTYGDLGHWFSPRSYIRSCHTDVIKVTVDEFEMKNTGFFAVVKQEGMRIYERQSA